MPMETIYFTIAIGTHTDSLPFNGQKLVEFLSEAISKYNKFESDRDNCGSITELEAIYDHHNEPKIDDEIWNNQEGWTGK